MQEPDLSVCPLFTGIAPDEIQAILLRAHAELLTVSKGATIVRQDDPINHLYLLATGLVRTEMITKEGNVLEIEFIEPVRPLAPAFLFANRNRFPVDVIAMEDCTLYLISRQAFQREMMQNETLLNNFLRLNSNIMVFLTGKVQMLSIKSLRAKLSVYILENTSPENPSFTMKRTQTQLAEYFGVQRPSLARTIGEMTEDGVIAVSRKEVTVLNRKRLESLV